MKVAVVGYIHFNGNAREALEFYHSVFGGKIESSTFADYESAEMPVPDEDKNKLMHAFLKGDGDFKLMMSDTPSYMEYNEGTRVSLALNTDDEAKGREYWDKLTEGGNVTMPLTESMWNSLFGMFTDRFGVQWMVDIGEMQE